MKYTIVSFKEKFGISAPDVARLLEELKSNVKTRFFGICYNLSDLIIEENGDLRRMGYGIVEEFSRGWRDHTGNDEHPIPFTHRLIWEGKQLEYRLDLIDYIIEQLKGIK